METYDYLYFYIAIGVYIIPFILCIFTQIKVSTTFAKYNQELSERAIPANKVARVILDSLGLGHIQVVKIQGSLTDYYNHKNGTIALSEDVYDSCSVGSLGIMAHEIGHAIQYKEGYKPIKVRNFLNPIANIISRFMWVLLFVGLIGAFIIPGMGVLTNIALLLFVVFFGITMVIAFATYPTEKNASKRALAILKETNILNENELAGAEKVLSAAALTYLASLLISIIYFLRYLLMFISSKRR